MERYHDIKQTIGKVLFWFDSILFSVLIWISISLLFKRNTSISILLLIGIVAAICLVRRKMNDDKAKTSERAERYHRLIDRLLLTEDKLLAEKTGCADFRLIRKEHPDRIDILNAICTGAASICVLNNFETASNVIKAYAPQIGIIECDALLKIMYPEEAGLIERAKRNISSFRFPSKYLILGILFLITSLFVKYGLYYRLLSAFCFLIATVFAVKKNGSRNEP